MKKIFPANKVLNSYENDDDVASSDNSRPNTQENKVPPQNRVSIPITSTRTTNARPSFKRVESSLNTPPPLTH